MDNDLVQRDSPLWRRVEMPLEGRCSDCHCWTESRDYDSNKWLCDGCARKSQAGVRA